MGNDGTNGPIWLPLELVALFVPGGGLFAFVLLLEVLALGVPLVVAGVLVLLLVPLDDEFDPEFALFVFGEGSEGPLARCAATIPEAIASPGINLDSSTSGAKRGRLGEFKMRRRTRARLRSGWNLSSELRSRCWTVRRKLWPTRRRPRNQDGRRRNVVNQL